MKTITALALAYVVLLLATITMTIGAATAEMAPAAYTGQGPTVERHLACYVVANPTAQNPDGADRYCDWYSGNRT